MQRGAPAQQASCCKKIHVVEETVHPDRSDENTPRTLRCLRTVRLLRVAGGARLREGKVFILWRTLTGVFGQK